MFESRLEAPQKEPIDYVLSVVKTGIASIQSWWAAPAAELFGLIIGSPMERRRDEFLQDLAWVVRETANRVDNLEPDRLANNEAFVSASIHAARIAVSTHQNEKRGYLRNALLNIALAKNSNETKHQIFMNAIETFSPAHVKAVDLMWQGWSKQDPEVWWGEQKDHRNQNYGTMLARHIPELKEQISLMRSILGDIENRGFSKEAAPADSFPGGMGLVVTDLGIEFVRFVMSPDELQ